MSLSRFEAMRARRDEAARREREAGATARRWYKIENAAADADEATIYIYDEIGYWGVTASDFAADLRDITASRLNVRINSPGGECYDGIAIYNTIVEHDAYVRVQVDALAASAASFIAMAGDEIEISKNAEMMLHDASGFCWGNAAEMRKMVNMLDRMSDNIASIYAERAGGELTDWRAIMQEERWYSAREAVSAKLADRVVGDPKPEDLPSETLDDKAVKIFDLSVFRFAGRRAAATAKAEPAKRSARVAWRPHADFDPDLHPRGDDGKFVEGLPEGIGGTSWMTMASYVEVYDVYDEKLTDSGITMVSMTNGDLQIAYDHPDDNAHRYVIHDSDIDEVRSIASTIEQVITFDAADTPGVNEGDYENDAGEHLFNAYRDGEEVTLTFYEFGDNGVDLEFVMDADEAQAVVDAMLDQADRAESQLDVDAMWHGIATALLGDVSPDSGWDDLAANLLTNGDHLDGESFEALREAIA